MKIVSCFLGFGVDTSKGIVVTHNHKINNDCYREIMEVVEKYYPEDNLQVAFADKKENDFCNKCGGNICK